MYHLAAASSHLVTRTLSTWNEYTSSVHNFIMIVDREELKWKLLIRRSVELRVL
jgi:hypothetical protein